MAKGLSLIPLKSRQLSWLYSYEQENDDKAAAFARERHFPVKMKGFAMKKSILKEVNDKYNLYRADESMVDRARPDIEFLDDLIGNVVKNPTLAALRLASQLSCSYQWCLRMGRWAIQRICYICLTVLRILSELRA